MPDTTNDIDGLLKNLDPNEAKHMDPWEAAVLARDCARYHAALTALVAERDALRKRVAELEAQPPADRDRDLRERDETLIRWMDQVTAMLCHSMTHSHEAKQTLVTRCDKAIDAMRKGDSDGK